MKLFIIVMRRGIEEMTVEGNRALWMGFEPNYERARERAKDLHPNLDPIFHSELSLWQLRLLLPFYHEKQK